jgi:hypothetical protein
MAFESQDRKSLPKPFQNSLSALAQVALSESGAAGYALFRRQTGTHSLIKYAGFGADIAEEALADKSENIAAYALGDEGIVVFAFDDRGPSQEAKAHLNRVVPVIESVWFAAQMTVRYSELASHVADLETRLLDSRISDRVRGYLSDHGETDTFEALVRHIRTVLDPDAAGRTLQKLSQELEEEVEERRLANRAKAILQSVHGMSEGQAHVHLRQTSRKTRRKLKDVAADLIRNYPEQKPARGGSC